jgi:hypothetical protein
MKKRLGKCPRNPIHSSPLGHGRCSIATHLRDRRNSCPGGFLMVCARPGGTAATVTLLSSVLALSACGGAASTPQAAAGLQQTMSTRQSSDSAKSRRCITTPCVYVANQDGGAFQTGSVTIYGVAASGNVAPLHTIVGEGTGLVGPVRIALDASHNVYVTNNASGGPGSVNVYAAGPTATLPRYGKSPDRARGSVHRGVSRWTPVGTSTSPTPGPTA